MSDRTKIINKIRALLNVTVEKGASENEAMMAAERASTLMAEYNLQSKDISDLESERWGKRGKKFAGGSWQRRRYHEVRWCVITIADFCDCKVWYSGDDMIFFGTDINSAFAWYLTDMIKSAMESEFKKALDELKHTTGRHGRTLRKSFLYGMANRLNQRMNELKRERDKHIHDVSTASTGKSLVVLTNAVLEQKFAALGMDLRTKKTANNSPIDSDAYYSGRDAANNVNLSRPVSGTGGQAQIGGN